MSMWDYLFDNEWRQRSDIESLKQGLRRSVHVRSLSAIKQKERVDRITDELPVLALYCRTMLTLMLEKGLVTRDEFLARMHQIDASDGRLDGRFTGPNDVPERSKG